MLIGNDGRKTWIRRENEQTFGFLNQVISFVRESLSTVFLPQAM